VDAEVKDDQMMIYLNAWGNAWVLYTLDPQTGDYSWAKIAEPQRVEVATSGFASMEQALGLIRRFYAVYEFEGRLYFQVGKKKWDITEGELKTAFSCWLGLVSKFCLSLNGESLHRSVFVHPSKAVWPLIDPTYDGIDFDSDHFLFFLSEHLVRDEWKKHVISMRERENRRRCSLKT
jgi:hypothetical protein